MPADDAVLLQALQATARPLDGEAALEELCDQVGGAHLVLIGEATHGTAEFYRLRAALTRHLIEERGFVGVAAEADWPDAYRVNRYVRGLGSDVEAASALGDFQHFPAWMWRNAEVVDFVAWLRSRNARLPPNDRAGFYGLDLYSLHASMDAVIAYLDQVDPAAAGRARDRYGCFDQFGQDAEGYGHATGLGLSPDCERQVVAQVLELQARQRDRLARGGHWSFDEAFAAEQNAWGVRNAEEHYRAMFAGRGSTWNLRDRHMADTLQALSAHLEATQGSGRLVVWAHNSHVGDARATEMRRHGELNLGQLVRERFPGASFVIGFTTHEGTVTAARSWGGPAERRRVRPALSGSHEELFHRAALGDFWLPLGVLGEGLGALRVPRLQRAIGVLYLPQSERQSHYQLATLPAQFDLVIHLDRTRAVDPLENAAAWTPEEVPETFPTGL